MFRYIVAGLVGVSLPVAAQDRAEKAQVERVQAEIVRARTVEQKALREALETSRKAELEAKEAPNDEAKKAALAKAQEALKKLAEAQRGAAQRAAQLQAAATAEAAQAAAARAGIGRNVAERDSVDPQNPVERFALLTPGGPVIVQASLTIDGEPFRVRREKLIAEMIAGADKDKDGQTTWTEALTSPRFTLGRISADNESVRASFIRTLDKNGNSLVETDEARQCLAQLMNSPTFALGGGSGTSYRIITDAGAILSTGGGAQADLLALLDTDNSKSLDAKEVAAATARLKTRDADDNDVLDSAEISGTPNAAMSRVVIANGPVQPVSGAILLGPTATADAVLASLKQKYKNAEGRLASGCFPLLADLFTALDKDNSGEIEAGEVLGLNGVPPHLELSVDLPSQKTGAGMKVTVVAAPLRSTSERADSQVLEMPGVRLAVSATLAAPPVRNFDSIGKQLLMQSDKDANGYLDATEMAGQVAQFARLDEDGDGKAYPAEISGYFARQSAPQATQVLANITQQGNSLFQTLDANGDGRLGLREMRAAAERLAALDKDRDEKIAGTEIPETISVSFAAGTGSGAVLARPVATPASAAYRPAASGGPEWFTRMDRNGDGDLTLKEFLGAESDFKRLDTNGDGLLEPAEAKVAAK